MLAKENRLFLIFASLLALCVSLLQLSIPFRRGGGASFFWSEHLEGVSLTTIGRWSDDLVAKDGMSGEFPVLYQYLSDWIINRLANLTGLPPFEAQIFYGAFLAGALALLTYVFVFKFSRSPAVALLSAFLITLSSDPILVDPLYILAGESSKVQPDKLLHVPSATIALGTAQGLAYFLLAPALLSIFTALSSKSYFYAGLAGVLFGLMLQTSFLTFIGLVSAVGLGLAVTALVHHATFDQRRTLIIKCAVLITGVAGIILSARRNITPIHFIGLWAVLFAVGITAVRSLAVLAVTALTALLVASPFLLHLIEFRSSLTQLDSNAGNPVRIATIFIFFMPAWIGAALLIFRSEHNEKRYELAYLMGASLALLLISKGDLWGFRNHQYRFTILLIFPLSIVFAMAVFTPWTLRMRVFITILLVWMSASMVRNFAAIAGAKQQNYNVLGSFFNYVGYKYADADIGQYLLTLKRATAEDKNAGHRRILLAPEFHYPTGLSNSALALGVSQLPGFIPDYRYLIDRASYTDRLRIFCFLFPAFPHFDHHTGRRACNGVDGTVIVDENRPIFGIRDLSLKTNVLNLLDIGILADHGSPFRDEILKQADGYDLQAVMTSSRSVVMKPSTRADRSSIKSKERTEDGWTLTVTAPESGSYTVILAGENIRPRFADVRFIDSPDQQWKIRRDVFIGKVSLKAGSNDLRLVRSEQNPGVEGPEETPFHFVAAIPDGKFDESIRALD